MEALIFSFGVVVFALVISGVVLTVLEVERADRRR